MILIAEKQQISICFIQEGLTLDKINVKAQSKTLFLCNILIVVGLTEWFFYVCPKLWEYTEQVTIIDQTQFKAIILHLQIYLKKRRKKRKKIIGDKSFKNYLYVVLLKAMNM